MTAFSEPKCKALKLKREQVLLKLSRTNSKECVGRDLWAREGEKGRSLEPEFLVVRGCLGRRRQCDTTARTSPIMVRRVVGGLGVLLPKGDKNGGTEENWEKENEWVMGRAL